MNIAEGCGRGGQAEFVRFLTIAAGSAKELEYQALLARDLGYLAPLHYERLSTATVEIERMLVRLVRKLRSPSTAVHRRTETMNYHLSPIT
jgi:four helix bundle protein